jgi:HSP90 family molecular chaperone
MDAVKKSPFIEIANKKNLEVLYLTDPLDEYLMQHMPDFEGNELIQ